MIFSRFVSVLGLGLFVIIWWTLIFAVLPFGRQNAAPDDPIVPGADQGAPARFALGRVVMWNTALSLILWIVVILAIEFHWIDIDQVSDWLLAKH